MEKSINDIMRELSLLDSGIACLQEHKTDDDILAALESESREQQISRLVYLDTFIPGIVEEACRLPEADEIKVKVFIQENTAVPVDKKQLRSVLLTLIQNAVIHHHADGDDRFVLVMALDQPNDVVIEIADNGPGITDELQEQLNDAFWSDTGGVNVKWLGMGLTDMKQFVESASASIELSTDADGGTTIRIQIPKK